MPDEDSDAQALQALAPSRIEATDPAGAIRVVLASDGLPSSIEVDEDWKHRLRHASFGQAVVDACRAAAEMRAVSWLRALVDSGLLEQMLTEPPSPAPPPIVQAPQPGDQRPRSRGAVADDILQAVDEVAAQLDSATEPAQGVGTAGFGKLALTVSDTAVLSCIADPGWVAQRSPEELTEALGVALASARAALAEAKAASPSGRLERLMREFTLSTSTGPLG